MSNKRKISIRKVLQVFVTLVVTTACVFALLSASKMENGRRLNGIAVDIKNGRDYHFLTEQQVKNMILNDRHINIRNIELRQVDIKSMEGIVNANPWVAEGQVYIDKDRILHANILQRVPVVRLFETDGNSYYLDSKLNTVPLSPSYIQYTSIVTNVPVLTNDSASRALKGQILSVVRFIEEDTFWNAQVSEIILDSNFDFEIIPVIGNQRIVIGDTSGLKEKFDNLFIFYKKVLNRIGWDRYQVLDVRFKNQVVASPPLPYKGPVDKIMSTMNWVSSIIDSNAKENRVSGIDSARAKKPETITKTGHSPVVLKSPGKPPDKSGGNAKKKTAIPKKPPKKTDKKATIKAHKNEKHT